MNETEKLEVTTADTVLKEVAQQELVTKSQEQIIVQRADEFAQKLLSSDLNEIQNQQDSITTMENIGMETQQRAVKQMTLLKHPIETLSKRAEDGGEVANALIDLKMTVESLDPSKIEFQPGWFTRLIGLIPGVGTPIKRYLVKFESAQSVISSIVRSLEMGRDQLLRDNITLKDDQKELWETQKELEQTLQFAHQVDKKLDEESQALKKHDQNKAKLIDEYLLFPVRQRLMDLQQQIAVQQQTVVASEIIIRNNKELVRGVNRALNVTVTALQSATTIAMALAHQEKVLQKIDKINQTTSKLITDTAARLKTQGTAIHKGAASAQIDVQALKTALTDIKIALDDISDFRQKALPNMANVVKELDHLIKETAEPLKRIEK